MFLRSSGFLFVWGLPYALHGIPKGWGLGEQVSTGVSVHLDILRMWLVENCSFGVGCAELLFPVYCLFSWGNTLTRPVGLNVGVTGCPCGGAALMSMKILYNIGPWLGITIQGRLV